MVKGLKIMKEGDFVKVKKGVKLTTGLVVDHWQGRIEQIDYEYNMCLIMLDSKSIDQLSDEYLYEHISNMYEDDPFYCNFEITELEFGERRDTDEEMKKSLDRLVERVTRIEEEVRNDTEKLKNNWFEEFQKSEHFELMTEFQREQSGFVIVTFMDFMRNYEYRNPKDWDKESIESVCLEIVPGKITDSIEFFEVYGDVLISFLAFLGSKKYIKNSKKLINKVQKIKHLIPIEAGDTDNWGMAKSLMMDASDSGIDLSDEAQINDFLNSLIMETPNDQRETKIVPFRPDPFKHLGRNQKINVKYTTGKIVNDIKFKKVEADLRSGLCELLD